MNPEDGANARAAATPSSLLRRLAEAVDCAAPNTEVWVVARRSFPHKVELVTPDRDQARRRATELGGDYEVFGPHVNQPVERGQLESPVQAPASHALVPACYHRRTTSEWVCSEADEVTARVEITVRNRNGDVVPVPEHDIDAVTLGFPAFEKFVVPYLFRVYGIAEAYRRWEEMRQHH